MDERLAPQEYIAELRKMRESILAVTSRAQALNEEEKPMVLAQARVGGIDLGLLVSFLARAEEQASVAVRKAELLLAD
jgi:hypothetical protein